ncbi:hypothetical protein SARC_01489 [Sphaeroforma arctica JP610]|uniref:EamA domain-containing protein n=1 Tax=Sphaeroforma arctica JP610 TaxID=667725 RepID=A0A0L0GBT4_9EUKA|nr:hypothetical protein SARC_01489 [Sphaeroforma arctica JP610]KNC86356.1 hypothetical protein SARC_01489 [Sphaeroforma arctica JP610]|eukprot:XP_014160258.1 hypothetical protein SARC_01489 [Sphaeroforma arctica JP610]
MERQLSNRDRSISREREIEVSTLALDLPSVAEECFIRTQTLQEMIGHSQASNAIVVPAAPEKDHGETLIVPVQMHEGPKSTEDDDTEKTPLLGSVLNHTAIATDESGSMDLSHLFMNIGRGGSGDAEDDVMSHISYASHMSRFSRFSSSTRHSVVEEMMLEMPIASVPNYPQILMLLEHQEEGGEQVEMYLAVAQPEAEDQVPADQPETLLDALHIPKIFPTLPELPTDIDDITLRTEGDLQHTTFVLRVSRSVKALGYFITIFAMLSISCLGLVTKQVSSTGVSEPMIGLWRSTSITLCILPLSLWQLFSTPIDDLRHILTRPVLMKMLYCSIGYTIWVIGFFVALAYTSVTHAYLLNTSVCVWLVALKQFQTPEIVVPMERAGALIALGGVLFSIVGGMPGQDRDKIFRSLLGDAVAFLSAGGAVWYLRYGNELRASMPLFLYMLPVQGITAMVLAMYVMMTEPFSIGRDIHDGLFGWMTDTWVLEGLFLGIVTGLLGVVTYIAALRMVPAVIVSAVMLLEPPTASAMAVIAGYETVGAATIAGGAVCMVGIALITASTRKRSTDVDVTKFVN